ncbi:hydroxyproline dehydrogenase-like isoform X1 [Mercenaria mercenaria]|uniref:hydroxyproline dehydrogenase-like isoform X1 n=1 Tax=Mercenaria mercenaria TaxID=6596 RepID=UPI00234F2E2A|nr:hydroxyproline dehydrogenase-like isoform X1 [Mercenaria mercenaria]
MLRTGFRIIQYSLDLQPTRSLSLFAPCHQKTVFNGTSAVTAHEQEFGTSGCSVKTLASFDVNDYRTAFKNKKMSEIVRALVIFKLCTYDFLVKNSLSLMKISKRLFGSRLYNRCMKATIYSQFVAGETEDELKVAIGKLQQNAMGPMLCVPVEEDAGQSQSRDVWYHENLEMILGCIKLSKMVDPNYPMSQIKLTAVVPGDLCAVLSEKFPDPHSSMNVLECIVNGLKGNEIDIDGLDKDNAAALNKALGRLKSIGELAENLGVLLLIDAEYTYLNPALRTLSLAMMLQFNRGRPIVAYTYQNYLKETYGNLQKDCKFVRSKGAGFATKLVRGAYMYKERQMAVDAGYEDPVHQTFEDTTAMYNQSMEHLLDGIQREPDKFYVVIASHNEDTVKHAVQEVDKRSLSTNNGTIFFGQSYGMSDYLSSALGQAGFAVYKSTPYGPVDETIPYLHRRALENSAVLGGTQKERQLLWKTFVNRITLGALPRSPA